MANKPLLKGGDKMNFLEKLDQIVENSIKDEEKVYCTECNACLNKQPYFNGTTDTYTCTHCGYQNNLD